MDARQFQLDWIKNHGLHMKDKYAGGPPPEEEKKEFKPRPRQGKKHLYEEAVDEELDLHGLTVDQGILAVEQAIQRAKEFKLRSIRVIHGMGQSDGPTMRLEVRKFLDSRATQWVNGYKYETHNAGAVIIYPKI